MSKHLHIMAQDPSMIASTVLLPGDPLRAKFIAENYLEDYVCYNTVRGMYGYTGTYKGKRISVQGTGMGIPSISIYINELINHYNVKNLIRIGSCGAISSKANIRDIIFAMSASTNSGVNKRRFLGMDFAPTADFNMLKKAYEIAIKKNITPIVGNVLTSDLFYDDTSSSDFKLWANYGCLAIEMETAELYTTCAKNSVNALSILTVSDHILTGEETSPSERQTTFTQMMEIALEIAE